MKSPMDSGKDCVLAWEAMPFALQGSLTSQQSQWLDNHLVRCESCREEFAQQQWLQRAMSLPSDLPIDAETNLERLLSRIDNPDTRKVRDALRPGNWLGRALVAAVLLQAIGLGVMGAKLWVMDPGPAYRTLSQAAAPVLPGSIRVVPDPSMKVADWDTLLHALELQVVAGPNDVGAYTVAPLPEAARHQVLLQRLRTTRGIHLAEPVAGTP